MEQTWANFTYSARQRSVIFEQLLSKGSAVVERLQDGIAVAGIAEVHETDAIFVRRPLFQSFLVLRSSNAHLRSDASKESGGMQEQREVGEEPPSPLRVSRYDDGELAHQKTRGRRRFRDFLQSRAKSDDSEIQVCLSLRPLFSSPFFCLKKRSPSFSEIYEMDALFLFFSLEGSEIGRKFKRQWGEKRRIECWSKQNKANRK